MGRDSFGLSVVAAILCVACEGCASAPPEGRPIPSASASRDHAAAPRTATNHVAAAVAYDDGTPGPIRQTADVWKETSEAVKRGLDRVAQAASPNSPGATEVADDPTSLKTQAKPSPELFIAAAQVHESAGRIPQAESAFQQAFRLAPKHLPTHLAYARFKDRQKQSREALEIYERLAREYPNEATVFNDLGLYYARRGMNREAIAAFDRAVQLQPKRALYRNNYAVALVQSDQIDAAMSQLMAAYTEADACYKLGYLLQKKGDSALAMEYFGRAVQLEPRMVEARQWY
ncbi:MAG: tetratricopeptide repeat protein, partial [Thermoguttaceae bacterium]|nr:tetratricopeptide repeat protein [Thermoguttaceae bacterium]